LAEANRGLFQGALDQLLAVPLEGLFGKGTSADGPRDAPILDWFRRRREERRER